MYDLRIKMKISTWNVRSFYQKGKLKNAKLEMARLGSGIFGMSEIRCTGAGCFKKTYDYMMYYSVALLMKEVLVSF